MHGLTFNSLEDLHKCIDFEISQIAQWEFAHTIRESWVKRLEQYVAHEGNYFET